LHETIKTIHPVFILTIVNLSEQVLAGKKKKAPPGKNSIFLLFFYASRDIFPSQKIFSKIHYTVKNNCYK